MTLSDLERREAMAQFLGESLYARTVWPTAMKCGMVTHVGMGVFLVGQPRLIPTEWGPVHTNLWNPSNGHTVWPKATKLGRVIQLGNRHAFKVENAPRTQREASSSAPNFGNPTTHTALNKETKFFIDHTIGKGSITSAGSSGGSQAWASNFCDQLHYVQLLRVRRRLQIFRLTYLLTYAHTNCFRRILTRDLFEVANLVHFSSSFFLEIGPIYHTVDATASSPDLNPVDNEVRTCFSNAKTRHCIRICNVRERRRFEQDIVDLQNARI